MLWKKGKKEKEENKIPKEFGNVGVEKDEKAVSPNIDISKFKNFESGVLKGFYISEKATGLAPFSQHVLKVFDNTTKNEIKKQIESSFGVKVRGIKIINLPRKSRTIGRHAGFKKGFKKAIVVLEKGYSIDQAKA